jgi:hypothetical protein
MTHLDPSVTYILANLRSADAPTRQAAVEELGGLAWSDEIIVGVLEKTAYTDRDDAVAMAAQHALEAPMHREMLNLLGRSLPKVSAPAPAPNPATMPRHSAALAQPPAAPPADLPTVARHSDAAARPVTPPEPDLPTVARPVIAAARAPELASLPLVAAPLIAPVVAPPKASPVIAPVVAPLKAAQVTNPFMPPAVTASVVPPPLPAGPAGAYTSAAAGETPLDSYSINEVKTFKKAILWTAKFYPDRAEFNCQVNDRRITIPREKARTLIKFTSAGLYGGETQVAAVSGVSFNFGKNKSRLEKWLPGRTKEQMGKDLRNWGIGLIVVGVVSFILPTILDPVWGGIVVVLGIINLLVRQRALFIVNGLALIIVGIMNMVSIISALSNGGSNTGWVVFGVMQIIWGIQEIGKYGKYANARA